MKSVLVNSSYKIVADGSSTFFGILAGIVTARALGPAGKGELATLTLLVTLFTQMACLGQGETAIVLVGRGRARVEDALAATLAILGVSVVVFAALLVGFCITQLDSAEPHLALTLSLSVAWLFCAAATQVLMQFLNIREEFKTTSGALFLTAGLTTAGTWIFVGVLRWSILGAVMATLVGSVAGLAIVLRALRRSGLALWPKWSRSFNTEALPFGLTLLASSMVMLMTGRADLLIVYSRAGHAAAGQYSVALTASSLVGMIPLALTYVSFPAFTRLDEESAITAILRTCRHALGLGALVSLGLLIVTPAALPALFGRSYEGAIAPTLILLVSYLLASGQWVLCRGAAALGAPRMLVKSYAINLIVMCTGDFALIPILGLNGAALAAILGSAVGFGVCLSFYRKRAPDVSIGDFFPGIQDLRLSRQVVLGLIRRNATG